MGLSKETTVELFDLQVRGLIATVFASAGIEPNEQAWAMLRGEKEVTMRDLGEISALGDFRLEFRAVPREERVPDGEEKQEDE
jgi:hypothetical protein